MKLIKSLLCILVLATPFAKAKIDSRYQQYLAEYLQPNYADKYYMLFKNNSVNNQQLFNAVDNILKSETFNIVNDYKTVLTAFDSKYLFKYVDDSCKNNQYFNRCVAVSLISYYIIAEQQSQNLLLQELANIEYTNQEAYVLLTDLYNDRLINADHLLVEALDLNR